MVLELTAFSYINKTYFNIALDQQFKNQINKTLLPSYGLNKIVHQEDKNVFGKILVSLFSFFVNPFPGADSELQQAAFQPGL